MVEVTIDLDEEVNQLFGKIADLKGVSKESYLKNALLERMEMERDYLEAVKSIEDSSGKVKYSRQMMMKKYDGLVSSNEMTG